MIWDKISNYSIILLISTIFNPNKCLSQSLNEVKPPKDASVRWGFNFNLNILSPLHISSETGPLGLHSSVSPNLALGSIAIIPVDNNGTAIKIGGEIGMTTFSQQNTFKPSQISILPYSYSENDIAFEPIYSALELGLLKHVPLKQWTLFVSFGVLTKFYMPAIYDLGISITDVNTLTRYESFNSVTLINDKKRFNYTLHGEIGILKNKSKRTAFRYSIVFLYGLNTILDGRYEYFPAYPDYYSTGSFYLREFSIGPKIYFLINSGALKKTE